MKNLNIALEDKEYARWNKAKEASGAKNWKEFFDQLIK